MAKRFSIPSLVVAMVVFNIVLLSLIASPSFAGEKAGKGKGKGAKQTSTLKDGGDDGDNKHPSGKDRSVEPGGSGTQGKSRSHPDDSKGPMRYEGVLGADKAGGPGGTDLDDQDGNNGCGNDDDFDDDNNGWCGKPSEAGTVTSDTNITATDEADDEVLPRVVTRSGGDDHVRGKRLDRPTVAAGGNRQPRARAGGASLPFTGANGTTLLVAALGLIVAGASILELRRRSATR